MSFMMEQTTNCLKSCARQNNTGAGCTFASSIASELVKGCSETEAVANAKAFVYESIKQSNEFGVVQYAK